MGVVAHEFPETRWSQLLALGDPNHPRRPEVLQALIEQYWGPAYHYVRALRRVSATDAEDLTQQFFTMLLARRDLEKLSPERGSFRGFLKTALRNFLASAGRADRARPPLFPFAEAEVAWQEHAELPPDEAFDRAWAKAVLLQAVARLREELTDGGRARAFAIFQAYCLDDEAVTYAELAKRFETNEDEIRNRLREVRLRVREILRRLCRSYLGPDGSIEEELGFILGS
jgi:RNA polymerase sigma-70 factor (ECF subfamily)